MTLKYDVCIIKPMMQSQLPPCLGSYVITKERDPKLQRSQIQTYHILNFGRFIIPFYEYQPPTGGLRKRKLDLREAR